MSNTRPFWLSWTLLFGLWLVFLGERILDFSDGLRMAVTGFGVVCVVGAFVWRITRWRSAQGDRQQVERLLFLGALGCVLALALYFLSLDAVIDRLGWFTEEAARERYRTSMTVTWVIVMIASLASLLFAQWADGSLGRHAGAGDRDRVEAMRVSEAASAGLTIALALGFLFCIAYVASERDHKWDVSYFKTSSPGGATVSMVDSLDEPMKVLLFFPEVSDVKDEVLGYFRGLEKATKKIQVETLDRMVVPEIAKKYRVRQDGTIVFVKGEQFETFTVGAEMEMAKAKLRKLDAEAQKAFMKVARAARVVYFTVGHGELNDPESVGPQGMAYVGAVTLFKQLLGILNYKVMDLGLEKGLGRQVPADASVVIVLGPRTPLLAEELATLASYAQGGGSLLVALDPEGKAELGPLGDLFGVKYEPAPVVDDKQHAVERNNDSDRRLIITDKFSSHASVTTLSRVRAGAGIILPEVGSFEEVGTADQLKAKGIKRSTVVRSLPTAFRDLDGDFTKDDAEIRKGYGLVVAVEGEAPPEKAPAADDKDKGKKPPEKKPMRAMLFADASMFGDAVLTRVTLNAALAADSMKWLGGEETWSGETISEEDIPIEHTRKQDAVWFWSSIVGAPLLVLAVGMIVVFGRRKRSGGAA